MKRKIITLLLFTICLYGCGTVDPEAERVSQYDYGYQDGFDAGYEEGYKDGNSDTMYEYGYTEDDLKEAYEEGYSDYEFGLFQWSDIEEIDEAISKLQDRRKELLEEN